MPPLFSPIRPVLILVTLTCCVPLYAQTPAATSAVIPTPTAPNSTNSAGANAVTQAAVKQGALACAGRINQVSNFLGFGPQAGAMLLMPPNQPDQHLISLAMEVPSGSGAAYVSAAFAPNQANGCGAAYDAVVYWPQKCDAVVAKQFASLKRVGPMKTNITMLDGGALTKIFLMPAGSGCVSIKKEVVF